MFKLNLKVHEHESNEKIANNTDIYIVDTYGKTKTFIIYAKMYFLVDL